MALTPTTEQADRFTDKIVVEETGCWAWDGWHDSKGYGRFQVEAPEQRTIASHRFAYLWFAGPIEEGLHLDHLCRNRACCNPSHVEPVTAEENLRRSDVALTIRSAATYCKSGHEFTPQNTYIRRSGRRACRQCSRESTARWYRERREGARRAVRL